MITLVIQTVKPLIEILIVEGDLIKRASWNSEKDEVARLLPEIEKLLLANKFRFADIDKIIAINGLGGFSSTRIGVTIANVLGMAVGAKLYEISWEKDSIHDLEKEIREFLASKPEAVKLVQPMYGAAPMISPSKKAKFV